MGFRVNTWATVWEVTEGNYGVNGRISTSRKNKDTGEYTEDFSGFVTFYGAAAEAAKSLNTRDRIKITACDVTNSYNRDTKETRNYFKIFEFETADGQSAASATTAKKAAPKKPAVDEGFNEDEECPF
jgi:hypothetical protein